MIAHAIEQHDQHPEQHRDIACEDDEPAEFYWANDIDDFLDGRCDEFSTVCRRPLGGTAIRLWQCLGLPYLNNDIIEKKLRYHFERAAYGESSSDWVMEFYR